MYIYILAYIRIRIEHMHKNRNKICKKVWRRESEVPPPPTTIMRLLRCIESRLERPSFQRNSECIYVFFIRALLSVDSITVFTSYVMLKTGLFSLSLVSIGSYWNWEILSLRWVIPITKEFICIKFTSLPHGVFIFRSTFRRVFFSFLWGLFGCWRLALVLFIYLP